MQEPEEISPTSAGSDWPPWAAGVNQLGPETVAALLGVSQAEIHRMQEKFSLPEMRKVVGLFIPAAYIWILCHSNIFFNNLAVVFA